MDEYNIVAILHPAADKVDEVRNALRQLIKEIHAKEDYTTRYVMSEDVKVAPRIVMIESFVSADAMRRHMKEPHVQKMSDLLLNHGLLTQKAIVFRSTTIAGFTEDRKLFGCKL